MRKALLAISILGSMRIGSVFAISLDSSNIVSLGCPTNATSCTFKFKGISSIANNTFINHSNLKELDLSRNSITALSSGCFEGLSGLTGLMIQGNNITTITSDTFDKLTLLEGLNLQGNPVNNLSGVFKNLSNLKYLSLGGSGSLLTTLNSGVFVGLSNLKNLNLYGAPLTSINSGSFYGLNNLTGLVLYNNDIYSIESGAFLHTPNLISLELKLVNTNYNHGLTVNEGSFNGLSNLEILDLSNINISPINSNILNFPKLKTLTLYGNSLGNVNYQTFINVPNVESLDLSRTNLTITSGTFNNLSNIRSLGLGDNNLSSLKKGDLIGLSNLTGLNLNGTNLTNIEEGVFLDTPYLTSLNLSYNKLTNISKMMLSGLNNLTYLSLNNNKINHIDTNAFEGLENLATLEAQGNLFTTIDSNTFYGLNNLSYVDLSRGKIQTINSGAFRSNTKLTYMRLLNNEITQLATGVFAGLPLLKELDLSYNQISYIDSGMFKGDFSMTNLVLTKNKLTHIEDHTFSDLDELTTLYLNANRLTSIHSGALYGLNKLQRINFDENQITNLNGDTFINNPLLRSLTIRNNQLVGIDQDIFQHTPEIAYLGMDHNQLTSTIDFNGLSNLRQLTLNKNHIGSLSSTTFTNLPVLTYFDITYNNITAVPTDVFNNNLPSLEKFTGIGGNCTTGSITLYYNTGLYTYINGYNCAIINGISPYTYTSSMTGVGYIGDSNLLIGTGTIYFSKSTANKFPVRTIMWSDNTLEWTGYVVSRSYLPAPYPIGYYTDIVEVDYPTNTSITQNGQPYIGTLMAPYLFGTENITGLNKIISVTRFGSPNGKIDFDKNITIRMPARGKMSGDTVGIYSSEDQNIYNPNGSNWSYEKTGTVITLSGKSYVEFTGNHASWWALISLPDTTPPIGTISYSTTNQTNSDVIATVTLNETGTVTSVGGNKHTFTQNGSFIFTFTDTAGNIGSAIANVTWITPSTINLFEVNSGNIVSLGCPITGTVCDLSNKKITSIAPNTFINHTQLTGLYINFNFLTEIKTDVFYGLSTLKELTLYGNKISSIESGDFNGLPNLSGLNIGSNSITKIESGVFSKLSNLKMLDLHINKIQTIESGGFMGLSNLTNLVLYQNYLTGISRGQFAGLSKLQELDIHYYPNFYDSDNNFITQYNAIRSIESGSFIGLSALKTIYLELNDINTIEVGDFAGLSNLQYLDLGANQINYIESGSFNTLTNLKGIIYNTGSMTRQQGLRFNSNCLDENSQNYISSIPDKRDNLGTSTVAETQKVCIAITYNTYSSTSGNVIGTLVFTGGTEAQRNAISADNPNLGSHTRTKNGTYSFDLTTIGIVNPYPNLWGWYIGYPRWDQSLDVRFAYKKILTGDVTWIRNTTPSISYSSTDPISGNVVATLSLSSGGTITSMGGNTHTFTQNGSFTFTFTDTVGNAGYATATVNNIDTTPPIGSISYSTKNPINAKVVATLTLNESGVIINNGGSNTYTFTDNGSFTFQFRDNVGNISSKTATVTNIDRSLAAGAISYSTTSPTSGSVTATLTLNETGTITNNGGSDTYTFTDNGNFTFTVIDNRGEPQSITATVSNIDKTKPIGTILYSTTEPINGSVIATINLNEVGTIINNGGDSNYLFINNGSFTFQFKDAAGNTGSATATVSNIDRTIPAGSISYSTSNPTNNAVTATATFYEAGSIINNSGSNKYTFNNNGTFTFHFISNVGYTGSITATVNNIDRTKPVGTVTYSTTGATNQNVIASLTLNETGTVNSIGGNTHTFTGNGSFTFTFSDVAGNTGSVVASVDNIDKTKPIGTISYSTTGLTNQDVIAIVSIDKDGSIITNNNGSDSFTFTGNRSFVFQFKDSVGNTGTAIASVNNIDKAKPIGTIAYSTTDPFNGIVTATLTLNETGTIGNNNGSNTFVFTDNGSFMFYFSDEAGNTGSTTAIVDNINKNAPIGTITYSTTDRINGKVTASLQLNKSGTILNNNGNSEYTFNDNGSFVFYFSDSEGNVGSAIAKVENINKMAPIGTITYSTTDKTNKAVIAELKTSSVSTILNNKGSSNYVFSNNGSFTFHFVDNMGNTGSTTATVNNIDRTAPIGTISYSTTGEINGKVTATITLNETGSITNNSGSNTYIFTDNGSFTFQFRDTAGNTGSMIATVNNINKNNAIFTAKTLANTIVTSGSIYNTGVQISMGNSNFTKAIINGKIYTGGSTITGEGTHVFQLTDDEGNTTGITFILDMQKPTCNSISPSNKASIFATELELKWNCSDDGYTDSGLSGLKLEIFDDNNTLIYNTGLATTTDSFIYSGNGGKYTWKIIATDNAGNQSIESQIVDYHKKLLLGTSYPGNFYEDTYYINDNQPVISLTGNIRFWYEIIGDVQSKTSDGYAGGVAKKAINLQNKEGLNTININYLSKEESSSIGPINFYVDTTKPAISIQSPISGLVTTGTSISFKRSATDTGSGISGSILHLIKNSSIVNTYTGEDMEYSLNNISNGLYSYEIIVNDYANNTNTSTGEFTITNSINIEDKTPEDFTLDTLSNKKLNYEYASNEVIVSGLSIGTKVAAFVDTGKLIINGLVVGMSGFVQNNDKVQIAIYSSKEYNETKSGLLTIGDKYGVFKVSSKTNGTTKDVYSISNLSSSEKASVSLIFKSLLGIYDKDQQEDFMVTFKELVQDKITNMEAENTTGKSLEKMKYLYNIINREFAPTTDTSNNEDTSIKYTAPNGKEYSIEKETEGYTSSNFIKSGKYFTTLSEIKQYINKNNRKSPYSMIDFTIDTSRDQSYIAPNGKKYTIFKTTDGRFGSNNFVVGKIFKTLTEIKNYIYTNNK